MGLLISIFKNCLKQDAANVHGLSFTFSDYPVIKYKLKQKIDLDHLSQLNSPNTVTTTKSMAEGKVMSFNAKLKESGQTTSTQLKGKSLIRR